VVRIVTSKGDIVMELFDKQQPVTAAISCSCQVRLLQWVGFPPRCSDFVIQVVILRYGQGRTRVYHSR